MGSYDAAIMTGFICRLCSELNRNVIHIYSQKGQELKLEEKIKLMPISVEPDDNLPKTICRTCVSQLNTQYMLIQQFNRYKKILEHHERLRGTQRQDTNDESSLSSNCETCDSNSNLENQSDSKQ